MEQPITAPDITLTKVLSTKTRYIYGTAHYRTRHSTRIDIDKNKVHMERSITAPDITLTYVSSTAIKTHMETATCICTLSQPCIRTDIKYDRKTV